MLMVILEFYRPMFFPAIDQFKEIDMLVLQDMTTGEIKLAQVFAVMKVDKGGIQQYFFPAGLADVIYPERRLPVIGFIEICVSENAITDRKAGRVTLF